MPRGKSSGKSCKSSSKRVYVHSYTRSNGTKGKANLCSTYICVVKSHYRTIQSSSSCSSSKRAPTSASRGVYSGWSVPVPSYSPFSFRDLEYELHSIMGLGPRSYSRAPPPQVSNSTNAAPTTKKPVEEANDVTEPTSLPVIFSTEPPEHLFCSICLDVMDSPVKTSCSYSFCAVCINQEVEFRKKCHLDRKELSSSNLVPNKELAVEIDSLKIHCFYGCKWENNEWAVDVNGCKEIVPLGKRQEHEKQCRFKDDEDV